MTEFFSRNTLEFLFSITLYIVSVPVLVSLIKYRTLTKWQKKVSVLVFITFLTDLTTFLLKSEGVNNMWVYHVFVPTVFVVMILIYSDHLSHFFTSLQLRVLGIAFVLFSLFNSAFLQTLLEFNTNAIVAASLMYILFSILYFHKRLNVDTKGVDWTVPSLWFNSGVLLYYSSTLVLFSVMNKINQGWSDIVIGAWILNLCFYFLLQLGYSMTIISKSRYG